MEVLQLTKATSPGDVAGNAFKEPIQLVRTKSGVEAIVWQPGHYTLQSASGPAKTLNVAPFTTSYAVKGSWQVNFPATSGAPANLTLEGLTSLTEHADPTVKYFSGTASYHKTFPVPASALAAGKRLYIDLGETASLAEVTLNGKNLGTLWAAPFTLDITAAAKVGDNDLQVRVTNTWHNRLVGEKRSPQSFQGAGVERVWTSSMPDYGPNEPLFPAGLIGPVTLRQAVNINVH
ncbi:hypothetical protein EON80_16745 [bacterium]|nr:MAG: hypothetical protein EON80_16745 [bacterium]